MRIRAMLAIFTMLPVFLASVVPVPWITHQQIQNHEIEIPDLDLLASINKRLSSTRALDQAITTEEALEVYTIICQGCKIADLTGLEHFTNLTTLWISDNRVSDLSPLRNLPHLWTIQLRNNLLSDLEPLSTLPVLHDLSIDENKLVDLSGLRGSQVRALNAADNLITDISVLGDMENLIELNLSGNQISDISPLNGLHDLMSLYLSENEISELPVGLEMPALRHLSLGGNLLKRLPHMGGLSNLESLDAAQNVIEDIAGLSDIQTLKYVQLWDNKISDLNPLRSSAGVLTELNLSSNQIVDIRAVSEMRVLESLDLNGNKIVDVSPISHSPQLRQLALAGNQITDVSVLKGLPNLVGLYVSGQRLEYPPITYGEHSSAQILDHEGNEVLLAGNALIEGQSWIPESVGTMHLGWETTISFEKLDTIFSGTIIQEVVEAQLPDGKLELLGDPILGETLQVADLDWLPEDVNINFEWFSSGELVSTSNDSYVVQLNDVGNDISVRATAFSPLYDQKIYTSDQLSIEPGTLSVPMPKVSGQGVVGGTLNISDFNLEQNDAQVRYQWHRNGIPISGAVESYFSITPSDLGSKINVLVTVEAPGYKPEVTTSESITIVAGQMVVFEPIINGELTLNSELSITMKTWMPQPIKVSYQWLRNGEPIEGATLEKYEISRDDLGQEIEVAVKGIREGYSPVEVRSPSVSIPAAVIPTRLAGKDRFATAVAISKASFAPGVEVAYVANGLDFPDALAGAAVAGMHEGPVLLTSSSTMTAEVKAELKRLKPGKIVVLGGTGVVTSGLQSELRSYTNGSVSRLAGKDRFATAVAISKASFAPGVDVAYVANGLDFPDALAGAAAAGVHGGPVLLSTRTGISAEVKAELKRLKPGKIIVLGGTGVVSPGLQSELRSFTSGSVSRLSGNDRFATAVAISKASFAPGVDVAYVANGLDFPDALAGAAVAGMHEGPVLLTSRSTMSAEVKAELKRLKPGKIVVLGGTGVVTNNLLNQLKIYEHRN